MFYSSVRFSISIILLFRSKISFTLQTRNLLAHFFFLFCLWLYRWYACQSRNPWCAVLRSSSSFLNDHSGVQYHRMIKTLQGSAVAVINDLFGQNVQGKLFYWGFGVITSAKCITVMDLKAPWAALKKKLIGSFLQAPLDAVIDLEWLRILCSFTCQYKFLSTKKDANYESNRNAFCIPILMLLKESLFYLLFFFPILWTGRLIFVYQIFIFLNFPSWLCQSERCAVFSQSLVCCSVSSKPFCFFLGFWAISTSANNTV